MNIFNRLVGRGAGVVGSGLVAGAAYGRSAGGLATEAQKAPNTLASLEQRVSALEPPDALDSLEKRVSALEQQQQSRPVVICGPSGVGKGTLLTRLMKEHPDKFGFSVSHATRKPRPGEVNGQDYHFVTVPAMEAAIKNGEFIEYAPVHGNYYGTSKKSVADV